jgi:DNA-directed RNA polymerase III subunit RPC3
VLIQQNLIYYSEETPETIYYEANQGAAYGLVRSGKILDVVESRYGSLSRDVVQKLLLLGHAKVCDLAETYQLNKEPLTNGNGHGNGNAVVEAKTRIHSLGQLDSILYNLLEAGLLEPVTELMFRSPDDIYNEVEKDILKNEFSGSTKGTKQKEMLKTQVRDKLGYLRRESQNWKGKGNKRKFDSVPLNGNNGTSKRRRLSNGSLAVNGHAQGDEGLRLEVGFSSYWSRI